jgi:hypothetical protein
MIKILTPLLVLTALLSCTEHKPEKVITEVVLQEPKPVQEKVTVETPTVVKQTNSSAYTVQTNFSPETGWGYDILENNVVKIHQPHIPVVQGIRGFKTSDDAIKVGKKVIEKLDKGIMPPSLSLEEMQSLGVL